MIVFFFIVYIAVSGLVALLVVKAARFQFPGQLLGAFLVALLAAVAGGVFYSVFEYFFASILTRLFDAVNVYPPLFSALLVVFSIAFVINRKRK